MPMLSRPTDIRSTFEYTLIRDLSEFEIASVLIRKIAFVLGWEELKEYVEFEISETKRLRDIVVKDLFTKCPKCGVSFNCVGVEPRYIPAYNVLERKCTTCWNNIYYPCADGSEPTRKFRSEGLRLIDEG